MFHETMGVDEIIQENKIILQSEKRKLRRMEFGGHKYFRQ